MSTTDSTLLRFFGAGGAFSQRYGTTCSELRFGAGSKWLIDCGRQAPDQLAAAGRSWHEFDGQIITHVHGDHVFGLENFAFRRFFESRDGVGAVNEGGPKPGLVAHGAVMDEVWEVLGPSLRYLQEGKDPRAGTLGHYFDVRSADAVEPPRGGRPWNHAERFDLGGLQVVTRESEHVPGKPSCSLELELEPGADDGPIAWWSGDCTVDAETLTRLEPRCTVFFHDCTFVDYPGQVHGAFSLIEALPRPVLDKLVIMHHEDDLESHRARVDALGVRVALPGSVWDLNRGVQVGERS